LPRCRASFGGASNEFRESFPYNGHDMYRKYAAGAALVLLSIAIIRVVHVDRTLPQGFDEPCHVAAGIEWLDRHTYTLDPVHPPLARYAIALPLYLSGARLPSFSPGDPRNQNYNDLGDAILDEGGHYKRNLLLARIGILPFLCLAVLVLFFWTRRQFGSFVACLAVGLFTTTPSILAFSALAYNDLPVASLQFTFIVLFTLWLEKPTVRMSLPVGVAAGLAISTKFTSLVFLAASAAAMLLCKMWTDHYANVSCVNAGSANTKGSQQITAHLGSLAVSATIALLILWGCYGFSSGRVQETMGLSPSAMPSFQHFPGPIRTIARKAVLSNPVIPAPELVRGFAAIWVANQTGIPAYLFGHTRNGGWWYFFPIALALKTPLPLLILGCIGLIWGVRMAVRKGEWIGLMLAVSIAVILMVAMLGKYNVGTRYLLVLFPLLSILAGLGGSVLWRSTGSWCAWGRSLLVFLLLWQAVATISAQRDLIAYFNELAPRDPSKALLLGCDLDCGQDLFRLAEELRARGVSHVNIAVWSSADISQMGLPSFDVLKPSQKVSGWVAVSARSLRLGDVLHKTYPPGSFAWLDAYQPVAHVGKTIYLYYIP
jgi:hypothetical protein